MQDAREGTAVSGPVVSVHPRDNRVTLAEATHTYYVDGRASRAPSVTKVVSRFFPAFDAVAVAQGMLRRRGAAHRLSTDPKYRHLALFEPTTGEVRASAVATLVAEWAGGSNKEARDTGTRMHARIEAALRRPDWATASVAGDPASGDELLVELQQFEAYRDMCVRRGLVPWRTEHVIFADPPWNITGAVDMQWTWPGSEGVDAATGRRRIVLADWKRTPNLFKPPFRGETGLGPLRGYGACSASKYELQLALYRAVLERHYDVDVVEAEVVAFHADLADYRRLKVTMPRDTAEAVLATLA